MKTFALVVVLVLAMSSAANASIIYQFVSEAPNGSNFNWTYNAQLAADQKIDTVTPGVAQPAFTTIFDFPGAISATSTAMVVGISTTTSVEATSTHAFNQNSPDNPTIPNVRTAITGTFTPSVLTTIFQVTVTSTFGPPVVLGELQESQALKNAPGTMSNNTLVGDTAQIEGPSGRVVPEAGTLLLIGAGLVGLTGLARRRR